MDPAKAVDIASNYAVIIRQEFPSADIYLFGSHATGTARVDSDIDVAVIVDKADSDWLDLSARLWHLTKKVSTDIEPVLLESRHDESGFVEHIIKTGTKL